MKTRTYSRATLKEVLYLPLDSLKEHLHIDHYDDDLYLEDLRAAAIQVLEGATAESLGLPPLSPVVQRVVKTQPPTMLIKLIVSCWYDAREIPNFYINNACD